MRLRRKTLRVFPNPWGVNPAALQDKEALAARAAKKLPPVDHVTHDNEGRPNGVVHRDVTADGGPAGSLVGAVVCKAHTKNKGDAFRPRVAVGDIHRPRQRTVYSFLGCTAQETKPFELAEELAKAEPVTIPYSEYYRALIAEGSLLAADEETAEAAGVTFVEPEELFIELSEVFAKVFDATYEGPKSAYEHFIEERAAEQKAAAPEAKPVVQTAPATASRSADDE